MKPGNIKVTPDGKVKVLDFGLAKAFAGDGVDVSLSNSPTLSMAATQQGIILGTAAYMSPEQARGNVADLRSDIWAFGCVLFEMLTGRQTFEGKTVSDIMAGVLAKEPKWEFLPANLHPRIRFLLESCLEKESKERCQGIAQARAYIQKALAEPGVVLTQPIPEVPAKTPKRSVLSWVAAVLLGIVVTGVAVWYLRTPQPLPVSRSAFVLPDGRDFRQAGRPVLTISSDGSQFVYNADGGLYLRSIDELESRIISGTEELLDNPTFSPEGDWLAYWSAADGRLKKIATVGGSTVSLTDTAVRPQGISWDVDETILYAVNGDIMSVSSDGGEPEVLVSHLEPANLFYPQLLPGGDAVLFQVAGAQVGVQSLDSDEPELLFPGRRPRYVSTGHIVYGQEDALFAVPFDLGSLEVTGGPVPLVEGLDSAPVQYAVSDSGSLVYVLGRGEAAADGILALVDRNGNVERLNARPNRYVSPRLSPEGTRLTVQTIEADGTGIIWVYDLSEDRQIGS